MGDVDQRKYPRANYPCHLTIWGEDSHCETILAYTSNIGVGGACVQLNQGFLKGLKVTVQLDFPRPDHPFKSKGVVVRCKDEGNKLYSIGIKFEALSEEKHAFMEAKVTELIRLEKKGK